MSLILADIKNYITFGPGHYRDEKWDLELITLNYQGQEIDIGGAFETKIFNEKINNWVHCPANLKTTEKHIVYDLEIPVVAPYDLISYKKLLSGEHQKVDIEAVGKYIAKHY